MPDIINISLRDSEILIRSGNKGFSQKKLTSRQQLTTYHLQLRTCHLYPPTFIILPSFQKNFQEIALNNAISPSFCPIGERSFYYEYY